MTPFADILDDLVHRVENAYGAVFLDDECEPIVHAVNGSGMEIDMLDFIGARQGLLMQILRRMQSATAAGGAREVIMAGDRMTIHTQPVEDEYFLVVVTGSDAIPARASFEIRRAVRALRKAL